MIRSGEHLLWDAHLVRLRALRRMPAVSPEFVAAIQRFHRACGIAARQAAEAMVRFGRAYAAAMERNAPALQEAARRLGSAVTVDDTRPILESERPKNAPTKENQ